MLVDATFGVHSSYSPLNFRALTDRSSSFYTSSRSGGGGRDSTMKESIGGDGSEQDRIDALGRLLTSILRHTAPQLNLNMRSDGYVKVQDLLRLTLKTFANVPINSHTVDHIKEAVKRDNKQRFSLLEENGELLIRANQGHTVTLVETESLLKPILSAEEFPSNNTLTFESCLVCIRRDANILIFLDIRKALQGGVKLYISDNKVILTEGFDGVVPVEYFERVESWPDRKLITFDQKF
ncbi:hypothetical protein L1987_28552 [Smallanthus sonchifolius]|uniref:Uncharacterized protein n=1 Tax=Smallanthus sonchifolius TaxID=185202 RepID=A0ACB9HYQ7_9ASTR|nr:hypothetical protein L1987_28552 [Smallanthus sonchifolius]